MLKIFLDCWPSFYIQLSPCIIFLMTKRQFLDVSYRKPLRNMSFLEKPSLIHFLYFLTISSSFTFHISTKIYLTFHPEEKQPQCKMPTEFILYIHWIWMDIKKFDLKGFWLWTYIGSNSKLNKFNYVKDSVVFTILHSLIISL